MTKSVNTLRYGPRPWSHYSAVTGPEELSRWNISVANGETASGLMWSSSFQGHRDFYFIFHSTQIWSDTEQTMVFFMSLLQQSGLICCWTSTAKSPNCTGATSSWSPWEMTSGMTRPWSGISNTPTTRNSSTTWILIQSSMYKWGIKTCHLPNLYWVLYSLAMFCCGNESCSGTLSCWQETICHN